MPQRRAVPSLGDAKTVLDQLYQQFDHGPSVADPVHLVRRYRDPADQEIVGFCAAALAFGRVASVLASIEALLRVAGASPSAFVRSFDPSCHGPNAQTTAAPLDERRRPGRALHDPAEDH